MTMFYSSLSPASGLGAASSQQVYVCHTSSGACIPTLLAQNCAGNAGRWRELIDLNPGKLTTKGPTAQYIGWINIPDDWQCPERYTVKTSSLPEAPPADTSAPVVTTPIVDIDAPVYINPPAQNQPPADTSTPVAPGPAPAPAPAPVPAPVPAPAPEDEWPVHPAVIVGGVAAVAVIAILAFGGKKRK